MTPAFPAPAWLVGCGNMAGAMVAGWRSAGVDFSQVTVIRPSGTPVEGVRTVTDFPTNERPRFVMLGFKPQKLEEVAPELAPHIGPTCILVSMLAGVSAATLRDRFPHAEAIVRVMPNLPVAQVQGTTAIYSADGGQDQLADVRRLMASLGMTPTAAGVARAYADFLDVLVIDDQDAELAPEVKAAGVTAVVAQTIMRTPEDKRGLAEVTLGAVQ